jgi:hypothetical protein
MLVSPETVERLRQILRTESLSHETELFELVKDGLANQFRRGFAAATGGAAKEKQTPVLPGSWDLHRRAQAKARIKNIFATVVLLLLVAGGLATVTAFRPPFSNNHPLADRLGPSAP